MNMRSRKKDHAKHMGELLRDRIITKVTTKNFFNEEPARSKLARKLHVDMNNLETVVRRSASQGDIVLTNPMARSDLNILELQDGNRSVLKKLFLQIYNSGKRTSELSPTISKQQASMNGLEEVEYRKKHMKFWNDINLPAPYLIGGIKELDTNGDYAVGLITNFWDGVTHDLDIIALNKRRKQIEKALEDKFLPDAERRKLIQEPKKLDELQEKILLSTLDTITEFALLGSEGLKVYKDVGGKGTITLQREDYEQKVIDYFNSAYSWHCKIASNPELKKQKPKIRDAFKEYMQPLLDIIADESKLVYAQGDEFLHHFQFYTFFTHEKDKVKSGVFDADHACLNRLERSRAKTLLSHLVNADYDTIDSILNKSDDRLHIKLHAMDQGSVAKEKLIYLINPAPNEARLDFDVVAVYEAICIVGRAAMDDLYNWRHKTKRQMKSTSYRNAHLEFPNGAPDMVSLEAYNSGDQIKKVGYRLNERLDRMISGKTRYTIEDPKLMKGLKGIKGILEHFKLPDDLPELPTLPEDLESEQA